MTTQFPIYATLHYKLTRQPLSENNYSTIEVRFTRTSETYHPRGDYYGETPVSNISLLAQAGGSGNTGEEYRNFYGFRLAVSGYEYWEPEYMLYVASFARKLEDKYHRFSVKKGLEPAETFGEYVGRYCAILKVKGYLAYNEEQWKVYELNGIFNDIEKIQIVTTSLYENGLPIIPIKMER